MSRASSPLDQADGDQDTILYLQAFDINYFPAKIVDLSEMKENSKISKTPRAREMGGMRKVCLL